MPDKFFTPYTLGCPKCRDEFNLRNNTPTQVRELGKVRDCPDNTLTVTVGPNDSIYSNTGHNTITVHCSKHNEHVATMYAYSFEGIEDIAYAQHDQFKYDCIVRYCEDKGYKLPEYEELKKYHPSRSYPPHYTKDEEGNDLIYNSLPPEEAQAAEVKKYEQLICDIYNKDNDYDEEGNYIPVAEREHHIEINKDSEGS